MVRFLLLATIVLCPAFLRADDSNPYDAYVVTDRAPVRSGPGGQWYVTSALSKGARIKVYHRTDEGWLAIQPTPADFSWVEAAQVTEHSNGVGTISSNDAVSWIGVGQRTPTDHKWQIRLKRGTTVELLEKSRVKLLAGHPAVACWKIAAPSREFRWIAESDTRQPSLAADAVQLASHQIPAVIPSSNNGTANNTTGNNARGKWRSPSKRGSGSVQVARRTTSSSTPRPLTQQIAEPGIISAATSGGSRLGNGTLPKVVDLRLKLSEMVTRPDAEWRLDGLREQAVAIVQEHKEPVERGRARLLLERIDAFRFMQHRRRLNQKVVAVADRKETQAAGLAVTEQSPPSQVLTRLAGDAKLVEAKPEREPAVGSGVAATRSKQAASFNARGWLVEVHSPNRRLPRYALLNRQGKVAHFLSPHPGLNVRRYLKREIGVFGTTGKHSMVHEPHVVAHRVVDLARHRSK